MESTKTPPRFRFGEFALDVQAYALHDAHGIVELEARAFDVLLRLIEQRERVVTKDELMAGVWRDQFVGESTLTRIISLLRKALRDSSSNPTYLLTVRGRGYRFIGSILPEPEPLLPAPVRGRPSTGVVGRERELEQGVAELDRALAGSLRLLWISGPAGIGKSSLAVELTTRAEERQAQVLTARCDSSSGAPPFWPWIRILRQLLEGSVVSELEGLLDKVAGDLVQLVPELGSRLPAGAAPVRLDAEESRFRLFDSVARLLRAYALRAGLVITLDDVHHADPPSLLLLEFLARHLDRCPLLVIACFRDGELGEGDPLTSSLGAIGGSCSAELKLGPLDPTDALPFLQQHGARVVPEAIALALHRRAGGNPLFLHHLVRSLATLAEPASWEQTLENVPAPATVLEAVRKDLARLSQSCVAELRAASVLGREFSLSLLSEVARRLPQELLRCVEEAIRARILEPTEAGTDRYRFSHALIWEALQASLPVDQRAHLHHRVACALQGLASDPSEVARLAHHYWHARPFARPSDVRRAQIEAAREALRSLSFEATVRHAQRALEIADPWPDDEGPTEVLLLIAEACHLRGDDAGMREWCFRAARQARAAGRFDLMAHAALAFFGVGGIGRLDGAWVSLAEETLEGLSEQQPHLRARLVMQLALEYYWAGYAERGLGLSAQGEAMARALDDYGELAVALELRLSLLRRPDALSEVLERIEEIVRILPASTKPEVELRILLVRHDVLLELGRLAEAQIDCNRVLRRAEELRLLWPQRVRLLYWLMDGRHGDVEAFLEGAFRSGRINFATSGEWAQNFMVVFFHLRLQQGRVAELIPVSSEWAARFPAFPGVRVGLATAHAAAGQPDQARELLDELARNHFEDFPRDQTWIWLMASLAEACLVAGCKEHMERLLRLLRPYAERIVVLSSDVCLGSLWRTLGLLEGALGHVDSAVRMLERALAIDAKLGTFLRVRTATDLCEAHCIRGGASGRRRALELAELVHGLVGDGELRAFAERSRSLSARA